MGICPIRSRVVVRRKEKRTLMAVDVVHKARSGTGETWPVCAKGGGDVREGVCRRWRSEKRGGKEGNAPQGLKLA
jgi:hypothetical protein